MAASELAILRNGFSIRHEHRLVMGTNTRLFLAADDSSFTDVPLKRSPAMKKTSLYQYRHHSRRRRPRIRTPRTPSRLGLLNLSLRNPGLRNPGLRNLDLRNLSPRPV